GSWYDIETGGMITLRALTLVQSALPQITPQPWNTMSATEVFFRKSPTTRNAFLRASASFRLSTRLTSGLKRADFTPYDMLGSKDRNSFPPTHFAPTLDFRSSAYCLLNWSSSRASNAGSSVPSLP